MSFADLADPDVLNRRRNKPVPGTGGRTLGQYVPFYFNSEIPMFEIISRKKGALNIVELVSDVEAVVDRDLQFVFSDGSAAASATKFFDQVSDLDQLDWDILGREKFVPYNQEAKRRRQSEFLVYEKFPFDLIQHICLQDKSRIHEISSLLERNGFMAGVS
jgi:hypothetical protein